MPNPYAPKRRVVAGDVTAQLDAVLERLRRCGADEDDLAAVRESWPPEAEVVEWFLQATDEELTAEIARVQDEYDYATRTEGEQAELDAEAYRRRVTLEVAKVASGNVSEVVAWIGSDPVRADVALAFETSEHGADRKGVKAHAEKVLADAGT